MPDKKLKEFNEDEFPFDMDEEIEDEEVPTFGDVEDSTLIICHCKPVYNFQSIEFDMEINPNDPEQIDAMFGFYSTMIKKLQDISVDQPKPVYVAPKEPLATDRQKEIMDRFHIPYSDKTTMKQAQKLITESMKG